MVELDTGIKDSDLHSFAASFIVGIRNDDLMRLGKTNGLFKPLGAVAFNAPPDAPRCSHAPGCADAPGSPAGLRRTVEAIDLYIKNAQVCRHRRDFSRRKLPVVYMH